MYYAHSLKGKPKKYWQTMKEHLVATAELSGDFAEKFNAKELGYTIGLFHDLGKYSDDFQKRLDNQRIKTDHSTAGMIEVFHLFPEALAKMMAYVISGHHVGLPDAGSENYPGSLEYRKLYGSTQTEYRVYKNEIEVPDLAGVNLPIKKTENIAFTIYFFIQMLFSCLVDADSLDTERFFEKEKANLRSQFSSFEELLNRFNTHMKHIKDTAEVNLINQYRSDIQKNCVHAAEHPPGMFTLTVPTGGGKTLSSMAFALNHAIKNKMDRIIYVIPYTSIIEQNAKIFRDIFGMENVLEHHSNFQVEDSKENLEIQAKIRLATDNWDMPIIVTTNVQFFESIFTAKRSKSRKLHNLANSVIILDEAQMLPVKYLKPCLLALSELVFHYHTTVVLCTATQPNLNNLLPSEIPIREIVSSPEWLYEKFRRTDLKQLGELGDIDLIAELEEHSQVLCIVNRREHARLLYEELARKEEELSGNSEGVYHLSTKMYPKHRKQVLEDIKTRLKESKESGKSITCKVISTQLIEAGVDVDFPVVYRAMAGLDSIIQAAGRCNREGKSQRATVYVFTSIEKHGQPPREIKINVSEAESIFRNHKDPMSLVGIQKYFELLYDLKNIDQKNILTEIQERAKHLDFPFREVGKKFKLIENNTISVIVPVEKCLPVIEQLKYSPYTYKIIRKLQPYIVNIYENEFHDLADRGGISVIDSERGLFAISDVKKFYDTNTGVVNRDDLLTKLLLY